MSKEIAELISGVPLSWRNDYLALEFAASEPYSGFVYQDVEFARRTAAMLFDEGAAEFSAPQARLLVENDELLGMFVTLTAKELLAARLKSMSVLRKAQWITAPEVDQRIRLAGATLLKPTATDLYLSRIAVSPHARGRGLGRILLQAVIDQAASRSLSRVVLEVSSTALTAQRLYERFGFQQIGELSSTDPASGASLTYRHYEYQLAVH